MSEKEMKTAERILDAYEAKEETALDRLKKTHANVQRPALIFAYVFGGIAALILGAGMSLIMTDFASFGSPLNMIVGIVAGVIGGGMALLTYPIYKKILADSKKEHAAEIMALKKELLGE